MHNLIVQLRFKLLVFLTHHMVLLLLRFIRAPQKFPYIKEFLQQLPRATFGNELVTMLDTKGLKLLPYNAKHDIKHILLQYETTDEGEMCLQCFMLGNKHLSFPVVATVLFGILSMPKYWSKFRQAYQRGVPRKPVNDWKWFPLLDQRTELLMNKINQNETENDIPRY